VQKKYRYFRITAPFLIFKIRCKTNAAKSSIIGINAGYIKKLADKSPFINKTKLRCMPQPGQSKWVNSLKGQGN
jgi:hypothetical protein